MAHYGPGDSIPGALVQLSARLAWRMVLHDWRAVLRSAPADGKADNSAGEAQELLPPID
jgi:hypothetical protein